MREFLSLATFYVTIKEEAKKLFGLIRINNSSEKRPTELIIMPTSEQRSSIALGGHNNVNLEDFDSPHSLDALLLLSPVKNRKYA